MTEKKLALSNFQTKEDLANLVLLLPLLWYVYKASLKTSAKAAFLTKFLGLGFASMIDEV
jgi:hypothetical protein